MRGARAGRPVLADGRAVEPRSVFREERHPGLGSLAADAESQAWHGLPHSARPNGTTVVGEPDKNSPLKTVNRYRHVTVRPDGLALFIVTDVGGNTQDASGRPAAKRRALRRHLEFRYVPSQQAAAPALPDVQKLGPQVGDRVSVFALKDHPWPAAHVDVADGAEGPGAGVRSLRRLVTWTARRSSWSCKAGSEGLEATGACPWLRSARSSPLLADFAARRGIAFPRLSIRDCYHQKVRPVQHDV